MAIKGGQFRRPVRIHALILTRNRPDVLPRCVHTALHTLGSEDALTVLDDSDANIVHANRVLLQRITDRTLVDVSHCVADQIQDVIARSEGRRPPLWQQRTVPRDIAPLRNLALLLSTMVAARTTAFIDDDIHCFDLDETHRLIDSCDKREAILVGARIDGVDDNDILTRLLRVIRLAHGRRDGASAGEAELFHDSAYLETVQGFIPAPFSGGYIAFHLPTTHLFGFPPGYNEDWLWCLLHSAGQGTRMLQSDQIVMHEPPTLREPTRDGILFETAGDIIIDSFVDSRTKHARTPSAVLRELARCSPHPLAMPFARATELLEEAEALLSTGCALPSAGAEGRGLRVIGDMARLGELDIDGAAYLRAWSADAVAKHWSFAVTLRRIGSESDLRVGLMKEVRCGN